MDEILSYNATVPKPQKKEEVKIEEVKKQVETSIVERGELHLIQSEKEFTAILDESEGRLVVLFASLTWCRPCKKIQPAVAKCAKAYQDVIFLKFNGNENDDTKLFFKDKLKARVTPAFFFFRNGELVGSCTGANPTKFETTLRSLLTDKETIDGMLYV